MLRFGSNGKFRVMHITDTHIQNENAEASLFLIEEAVRREMPDIVILDVMMPEVDGYTVAQRIPWYCPKTPLF